MKTVFDYIDYYKEISFLEDSFNDMDNIVFSLLTYLPFEEVKDNNINIGHLDKLFENKKANTPVGQIALKILGMIKSSNRYKGINFSNIVYVLDSETQFCAVTIKFLKDKCYVAFRGTDNSLTGWKENLQLAYKYPVKAQSLATNYLKKVINSSYKVVYVGGHSKGGNLAMASVMETDDSIYNKIKTVYNNDGPGFLKKQYDSASYKKMESKLKFFMPEDSVVGILLFNSPNAFVVKSNEFGARQHYLNSWGCFGRFLIEGRLSKNSARIQKKLNSWALHTDDVNKKLIVDTLFEVLNQCNIKYFYEIKSLKFSQFSQMIREAGNIDEESKQLLLDTLKDLLFPDKNNE